MRPSITWQPIDTAPKDEPIIGALIRDNRIWRVHDMKHNGLAFYTLSGDSLPKMTHWIPMPFVGEVKGRRNHDYGETDPR